MTGNGEPGDQGAIVEGVVPAAPDPLPVGIVPVVQGNGFAPESDVSAAPLPIAPPDPGIGNHAGFSALPAPAEPLSVFPPPSGDALAQLKAPGIPDWFSGGAARPAGMDTPPEAGTGPAEVPADADSDPAAPADAVRPDPSPDAAEPANAGFVDLRALAAAKSTFSAEQFGSADRAESRGPAESQTGPVDAPGIDAWTLANALLAFRGARFDGIDATDTSPADAVDGAIAGPRSPFDGAPFDVFGTGAFGSGAAGLRTFSGLQEGLTRPG